MGQLDMGSVISERRKELGITQRQLADRLYITDKAVSKWERGQGYPDITMLNDLAAVMQLSVSELMQGAVESTSFDAGAGVVGAGTGAGANTDMNTGANAGAASQAAAPTVSSEARRADIDVQMVVDNSLQYADTIIKKERSSVVSVTRWALNIACLIAIFTCLIVDLATGNGLSWSWIAIAAICVGWGTLMPLLIRPWKNSRVWVSTTFVTVTVPMLLAVIYLSLPEMGVSAGQYYWAIAGRVTVVSLAVMWLTVWIILRLKVRWEYKVALFFVLGAATSLLINGAVAHVLGENFPLAPDYNITVISCLLCAGVAAGVGTLRRSR